MVTLALLTLFATGLVLPVLPLYARSFGVGYTLAGVFIGSFYIARLAVDIVAGSIVRRTGEATAAAGGLLTLAAGALLAGTLREFWLGAAAWALAGAGSAVVFTALYSALFATTPPALLGRALSLFYGAFNVGLVAGGFLGGIVASRFGLAAPLHVMAGVSFILAVGTALGARRLAPRGSASMVEARPRATRHSLSPVGVLRLPGVAVPVIAIGSYLFILGGVVNTLVPLFARDSLGMGVAAIGVVYAVLLAAEMTVLYPAGSWTDRRGRRAVMIPSFAALAAIIAVTGLARTGLQLTVLMVGVGLASGVAGVPPAAMLSDLVPDEQRALGVAAFRFGGDAGLSLGPLLAGLVAARAGFGWAFALAALPLVVALCVVAAGPETIRHRSPQGQ